MRCTADDVEAMGSGADEQEALIDLWSTLIDRDQSQEEIAYVAAAYDRRARKPPHLP